MSLTPLLGLGLTSAHTSRDSRMTAQIAETLKQEAELGTLVAGTGYFDNQGNSCASGGACYSTYTVLATTAATGTRLTVQVTPIGNPQRAQSYAMVLLPD